MCIMALSNTNSSAMSSRSASGPLRLVPAVSHDQQPRWIEVQNPAVQNGGLPSGCITQRHSPPTRRSISATDVRTFIGPHQSTTSAGSVNARNTRSMSARNVRSTEPPRRHRPLPLLREIVGERVQCARPEGGLRLDPAPRLEQRPLPQNADLMPTGAAAPDQSSALQHPQVL